MRLIRILAPLVLVLFSWTSVSASEGAYLGGDGLHKQVWFYDSFLDMGEDLQDAADTGKGLIVLFEQVGCPYCKELHEVNFNREEIVSLIQEKFLVVQIDLFGSREVVDFDGEVLEERDLARKWRANFTPTTAIFPPASAGVEDWFEAQALMLPGYLKPFHYMSALEFVESGAYTETDFQRFLQAKFVELQKQGITPEVW